MSEAGVTGPASAPRTGPATEGRSAPADDAELEAYHSGVLPAPKSTSVLLGLLVAAIVLTIPITVAVSYGASGYESIALSYPGVFTSVLSAALSAIAAIASWATFGALLVLLFLIAGPRRGAVPLYREPEMRIARIASAVWMCAAGLLIVVDAADQNGQVLSRVFEPGALGYLIEASYMPRAWIVSCLLAATAFVLLGFAERWTALLLPLGASVFAIIAPTAVGQVLVGHDHDFGSDAGVISAVTAPAIFGIGWVLATRIASGRLLRPRTLSRTFWVMSTAWILTAGTEILLAAFTLNGDDPGNPTAALRLARGAILLAAGIVIALGALWRRRLTASRIAGSLIALSVLGAGYLGVTLALEQVPPPHYFNDSSIMTVFFGFDLTEAPSAWALLTTWRPNLLFCLIAAAAVAVYLVAYRAVRRRGIAWPVGRVVAWLLGWAVVVVATSSGIGVYSGVDFGIHMIGHMALNMLGPILLVLGGVVTLLLRATTAHRPTAPAGPHEWLTEVLGWRFLHVLYNPLLVFVFFVGSYYALYLTGLFEALIRYHWAHQAMNLHFLIAGYLYYSLVIGVDRPPRPLPPLGKLGFVLAAMPFHAFFGVILMMATTPIAVNFYEYLDAPWAPDLMSSQYIGGGVAWAGGELPLIIVIVALGIQWARQDRSEARRRDRHFDSGVDDEFEEYNRMLEELARREDRAVGTRTDAPS